MSRVEQNELYASVHGLILMNAFHTDDDVNNSDVSGEYVKALVE